MKGTEFYVGYLDTVPKGIRKFMKIWVVVILTAIVGIAWLISFQQKGFVPSTYEYDQEIELSGLLVSKPIPAIRIDLGNDIDQKPLTQTIPIVAFGKKGGMKLIQAYQGSWAAVKGHLIYYDGKALLEITNLENIQINGEIPPHFPMDENIDFSRKASLVGEIVDAKCFFGVMKPGHGKPHRSCAIRCISGGIPAVLKSTNSSGSVAYSIIVSETNAIQLVDFVGETVKIEGSSGKYHDWNLLKAENISAIKSNN